MDACNEDGNGPAPIQVIGLRRCGSQALRVRLNRNSQCYAPHPVNVADIFPLVERYGDLQNDEAYFKLCVDIVGLQNANMVKWDGVALDPVKIFQAIQNEPKRSALRIGWELLFQAGKQHGAKVVVDKSMASVYYPDDLMDLFPKIRFINLVRDPRAQVASLNLQIVHDFDTLLNARTYVKVHDNARALIERFPNKVLTVRFEDFLADQESVLRKVCDFIGIDFEPGMLDVQNDKHALHLAELSTLWRMNCVDPVPDSVEKYKQQLTKEEIAIIETLAEDHMRFYGYPLSENHYKVTITDEMIAESQIRSDERELLAWAELKKKNPMDFHLRQHRARYLRNL